MKRKLIVGLTIVFILFTIGFAMRHPLMRACATALMHQDKLQKADAMFVLSGGGYDRGNEAVKVFSKGYTDKIICTGGNPFIELKVFNIDTLESDMTAANLRRQQISDSNIAELRYGTSTREESDSILSYCVQQHLKKVIVLSSLLHTGRVNSVFRKKFEQANIQLIIHGAPSSRYDEYRWWESEDGLIAVNNEWLKKVYYWWKY